MSSVQLIIPDVVSIWNFGVSLIGQGLSSLDSRFRGNDEGRAGLMNIRDGNDECMRREW